MSLPWVYVWLFWLLLRKRDGRYYIALWQANNNTPNKLLLSESGVSCQIVSFTSISKGRFKFVPQIFLLILSHEVSIFLEEAIWFLFYLWQIIILHYFVVCWMASDIANIFQNVGRENLILFIIMLFETNKLNLIGIPVNIDLLSFWNETLSCDVICCIFLAMQKYIKVTCRFSVMIIYMCKLVIFVT